MFIDDSRLDLIAIALDYYVCNVQHSDDMNNLLMEIDSYIDDVEDKIVSRNENVLALNFSG